jgi:hypothetical protein
MEDIKDIASKSERKLIEQTSEFNILRDRSLVVSGFGIAILTAIFSFWTNIIEPWNHIIIAISFISLISISVMIYSAFSNPLNRGMDSNCLKNILENPDRNSEDFYLNEIAYNLESFKDNTSLLKRLQYRLNAGLIVQTIVSFVFGIAIYFNQIANV